MDDKSAGRSPNRNQRIFAWDYKDIQDRTEIFFPGDVTDIDAANIPHVIPAIVTRDTSGGTIFMQLAQAEEESHLEVSREIEAIRQRGPIRQFGMHVTSSTPIGGLVDKIERSDDGGRGGHQLGEVEASFWAQVEGEAEPVQVKPIRAIAYAKRHGDTIEFHSVTERWTFGPLLFCPEWWCLAPWCHSHWYWWPGVPATTVCGGGCVMGGPCQCFERGVIPPAWMNTCSGFKTCWC